MADKTMYQAFKDLNDAWNKLFMEVMDVLYVTRLVDWLAVQLDRIKRRVME